MKILVTGARGFIGKNLISRLKNFKEYEILPYDVDSDEKVLESYCQNAEFVYHLAGVNRPLKEEEYMEGNYGFTHTLIGKLKAYHNYCPILLSSSIQATLENSYGYSKKAGEDLLLEYANETGSSIYIYRLPNVFGKWSRPNYNSVVATFCYQIARNLPIQIDDSDRKLKLVYIDDVIKEFIGILSKENTTTCMDQVLSKNEKEDERTYSIPEVYSVTVGKVAELIYTFYNSRKNHMVPNMSDPFTKKLYSTYLSYLKENDFSYKLSKYEDTRGVFAEFLKFSESGQISINTVKPRMKKGEHWHHTKNEKFLVLGGRGIVRLRHVLTKEIIEYEVSGDNLEVIDIPVGYTHHIENTGDKDLIMVIWANEWFNQVLPDTYSCNVILEEENEKV